MSLRSGDIVIGVGQRVGSIAALGLGRCAVVAPSAYGQPPRAVRFVAPSDLPGHRPANWPGFCVLRESSFRDG